MSHLPIWVGERLFERDPFQFFRRKMTKRPTGRRQIKMLDLLLGRAALQALKDGGMLTVDRQERHAILFCHWYYHMPRRHKGFLICQRDVFFVPDRLHNRAKSDHPDHRRNDRVYVRHRGARNKPIHAIQYFRQYERLFLLSFRQAQPQFLSPFFTFYTYSPGLVF